MKKATPALHRSGLSRPRPITPPILPSERSGSTIEAPVFRRGADEYVRKGWAPVPIDGNGAQPEKGIIGAAAPLGAVTAERVAKWSELYPARKLGLRLEGVVSLDVDDPDAFGDALQDVGALPPSFYSTARGADSRRRQVFYRVTDDLSTLGAFAWGEIVSRNQRYTVVWPSPHDKSGGVYHWYSPGTDVLGVGVEMDGPPHIDDLPDLPEAWVDAIRKTSASAAPLDDAETAEALLATFPKGRPTEEVEALMAKIERLHSADHVGHPTAAPLALEAFRLGMEGHPGARKAVKLLGQRFAEYLETQRDRDPREAVKLLEDMASVAQSKGTMVTIPKPAAPSKSKADKKARKRSFYIDVAEVLAGDMTPPEPDAGGVRPDGRRLLYRGKVSGLVGESGVGKTIIAACMAADDLRLGGSVLWIDVDHNGSQGTIGRLIAAGISADVLTDRKRFRLAVPEDADGLRGVVDGAGKWFPTMAVVDSVGEVLPMFGGDSNSADDYSTVHRAVFTPLADVNAAVLVLDHLAKTALGTGYASGTGAKKRTMDGAYYGVKSIEAFRPGVGGGAALTILKDRFGGVAASSEGETAAVFRLDSRADQWTWEFYPGKSPEERAGDQLEADVAFILALDEFPKSKEVVIAAVRAKSEDGKGWRAARAHAALTEARNRRGALTVIPAENSSRNVPNSFPELSPRSVPSSPLLKGERERGPEGNR
jgi:hypothetical protein